MSRIWLHLCLGIAVALLAAQMALPPLRRWYNAPRPGVIATAYWNSAGNLHEEYVVYLPEKHGVGSTRWPLIVFLHGSGECGRDASRLVNFGPFHTIRSGYHPPAIVVAPQSIPNVGWPSSDVHLFVEHVLRTFDVDKDRVSIAGFSLGGYGAWQSAIQTPDRFSAVVLIAGGGDVSEVDCIRHIPIWVFHGAADDVVPLEEPVGLDAYAGMSELRQPHTVDGIESPLSGLAWTTCPPRASTRS